jgi:hypothetical protein
MFPKHPAVRDAVRDAHDRGNFNPDNMIAERPSSG